MFTPEETVIIFSLYKAGLKMAGDQTFEQGAGVIAQSAYTKLFQMARDAEGKIKAANGAATEDSPVAEQEREPEVKPSKVSGVE